MLRDPQQTNLVIGKGDFLVPGNQRYNEKEWRNVITNFVILDEYTFRVVEGEGFK